MNRLILQIFALGFCFAIVHTLKCYNCKIGFFDVCFTTETTCASGEHCFSGTGKAVGFVDIMMKGCLAEAECNQTSEVNFPSDSNTTAYTMTKTCCNTDLCNSAPGLPGGSGLKLALASVAALFVAHLLV
ncbi:sperm acrosome membrane-associated protein 4 [Sphaeramia orbicularis]|uniref:UPAR/Ly6 domain-containing protein n=1 Tax=Sphaeramia orbicularis TaxID=375764 RepID=A0A672Z9Z1_9TELE|nr:sperm acrosome membrane-associated protein 4 [Sphaeramia orbicularis]